MVTCSSRHRIRYDREASALRQENGGNPSILHVRGSRLQVLHTSYSQYIIDSREAVISLLGCRFFQPEQVLQVHLPHS